jgi:hypothetical protein
MTDPILETVCQRNSARSPARLFCGYAQTNIQLFNQMRLVCYADSELHYIYQRPLAKVYYNRYFCR